MFSTLLSLAWRAKSAVFSDLPHLRGSRPPSTSRFERDITSYVVEITVTSHGLPLYSTTALQLHITYVARTILCTLCLSLDDDDGIFIALGYIHHPLYVYVRTIHDPARHLPPAQYAHSSSRSSEEVVHEEVQYDGAQRKVRKGSAERSLASECV